MVNMPSASKCVTVYALNTNRVLDVPASAFLTPDIPGSTYKDTPCLSFLVEHCNDDGTITRLLFDLGIRKDWKNLPPQTVSLIEEMDITIATKRDVAELLQVHGVEPGSIDGIIFSHWHFDHVGDATTFPATARIIVGPGFKSACLPGFPADPDSMICGNAFEDRDIYEASFAEANLSIASLPAIDWFDDGSFYLLHTPGHAVGHMSALARTSVGSSPETGDSFVLLAGDVCHHAGELRPHPGCPLPQILPTFGAEDEKLKTPCQYLDIHPEHSTSRPFYRPACGGFNLDAVEMQKTVEKVARLDSDPRVFVILAHDHWVLSVINHFPDTLNDWKDAGWAAMSRWRFLQDFG